MKIDLNNLAQLQQVKKFDIGKEVYTVAFSPNGDLLAVGSNHLVQVWQVHDGRLLYSIDGPTAPATTKVLRVGFSSDMKYLVSLFGNQILLSQASDGQAIRFLQPDGNDAVFSPDNTTIVIARADMINFQSLSTGAVIKSFQMPSDTGSVWSLCFSPDGAIMAAGTATQRLQYSGTFDNPQGWTGQRDAVWRIFNPQDGRVLSTQKLKSSVTTIVFSQKDNMLAITTQDGKVLLSPLKIPFLNMLYQIGGRGICTEATFSPDGMFIAIGTRENTIWLLKNWLIYKVNDPKDIKTSRKLEGHFGAVNTVAFSPDGTLLASGSNDKTVQLWGIK